MHIPGARVLDLFSGSGALALEALSRGAAHATLVELSPLALKLIQKNIMELGVRDQTELISDSVDKAIERLLKNTARTESRNGETGLFDIVLADPPYGGGWETRLLQDLPWARLLRPEGLFCMEWGLLKSKVSELPPTVPFLVKVREKIYGESVLTTYAKT